jgi:predicted nuclease of predicted toxin-antitoxin system
MKIWIDAQLPPTLASWVTNTFAMEALSLRDIGLRDAKDIEIFELDSILSTSDRTPHHNRTISDNLDSSHL